MKISEIYNSKGLVFSCEIFPPRPEKDISSVYETVKAIKNLEPDFISVTYGAGGGTRARTIDISSGIKKEFCLESLMHLTCINSSAAQIKGMLKEVRERGVENILALRGDILPGTDKKKSIKDFRYAADLVRLIKKEGDFSVGVAGYPEKHPESQSFSRDIQYLKNKVDAGADFIITQLFFNNDFFYRFRDRIRREGVSVPLSAGIMPVFSEKILKKSISLSGATIPSGLKSIINRYGSKPAEMEKAGIEYAARQVEDLIRNKTEGVHIYIMNRPVIAEQISALTGLR